MTIQNASIAGICAGNDLDVNRTVPGIPATQTLTKAWLTFKTSVNDADPGLLQKVITPSRRGRPRPDHRRRRGGTAQLLFQIADTETLALPVDTPTLYDIKVLTSAGKVYTTEKGLYLATSRHQVHRLMRDAHARAMAIALKSQGVAPARAEHLVALYKKRGRKLRPIKRNRAAVKAARSELAKQIKDLFDRERPKIAHQISTLIRRTGKSEDDRVEQIMGELDFDGWVSLVVDGQKILVHIVIDGSGEAITQVGQKLTPAMLEQVNEAAIDWAHERAAELVGMKYAADGTLIENPNAEWAITDSTRELLRSDVAKAIDDGLSPASSRTSSKSPTPLARTAPNRSRARRSLAPTSRDR
jgi:hypothetical protein